MNPVPFVPHSFLKGPHRMTLFPRWWRRSGLLRNVPVEQRNFQVAPHSIIVTKCNWQPIPQNHHTLMVVHGLEGCADSHYMKGIAHKAWHAGLNVVRVNQRNCGGTEHLTSTLYNNGLSGDLRAIITELATRDGLSGIWAAGYSMGGNLALKLAGEVGKSLEVLKGVVAVCPNIHPAACVLALQQPRNWIYHRYFLTHLKARLKRKVRRFPQQWDVSGLEKIRTMWEFDDVYTAPDDGYKDAEDYYGRSGARRVLGNIQVPTLVMTAQDDPFIPFTIFEEAGIHTNPHIQFLAPHYGGHCGFFQRPQLKEDLFWAENRMIEFVHTHQ